MHPRITLLTLGVADLDRARRFYREGLGFPQSGAGDENVAFFRTGGMILALWSRESLAEDAQVSAEGSGFSGIALAHNVGSREEVDQVITQAAAAGATITKLPGEVFWGGYTGYFADPDGYLWEVAHNPFWTLRDDGSVDLPE
jgi:uncharacterized protein